MAFRPLTPRERRLALAALAGLIGLTFLLVALLLRVPLGPATVLLGALWCVGVAGLGLLVYRLWQMHSLDYWLDRDAMHILWSGDELFIPMSSIKRIEAASPRLSISNPWWVWPVRWVHPRTPGVSWMSPRLFAYATRPASECLAVTTGGATYLVSPADPHAFLEAFESRQAMGAQRQVFEDVAPAAWREHWLWRDPIARFLLAAGLLFGLFLLGYCIWSFPDLPAMMPLHFDAAGVADRISPRRALFLLPAITLLMWFLNVAIGYVLYEYERLATYLLFGNGLALQVAGLYVARSLMHVSV